jgi:hypothetical protein
MNQMLTKVLATSITTVAPTALADWGKGSASCSEGSGNITLRTHHVGVPEEPATAQKIVNSYSASQDNT